MATKRIGKVETIHTHHKSPVRLLEEGIVRAHNEAMHRFGVDDNGHAKVKGWQRSCCSIQVEFKGFVMSCGMMGPEYTCRFEAWAEKYEDDEAD